MHPRLVPFLFSLVALCTVVALTLWGRIAPETPVVGAREVGAPSAVVARRELPTEVRETKEAGSIPRSGPMAPEIPVDSIPNAGAMSALRPELPAAVEEVDSVLRNRRVTSDVLNVDALRAGDESAKVLYAKLLARVEEAGSVPLIIGLSAPIEPEGRLTDPGEVDRERRRITAVQDHLLADLAGTATEGVKRFETVPYLALTVDPEGFAELLRSDPVITLEEDVAVPATLLDSVPLIGANRLHRNPPGYDGTGVTVAILDTGVDKNHPFLDSGKVVSEACYSSTNAVTTATSVCPGGSAESTAAGSGVPCDTSHPACHHGTHVAGIAAGKDGTGATGGTLQGTAPGANIIAIQVFSQFDAISLQCLVISLGKTCFASHRSDQMKGLERVYALRNTYNIAAVNMSLGGREFRSPCDGGSGLPAIVNRLRAAGIATVISSGNDGFDGATNTPACISSAITVGASDKDDNLYRKSNHASWVDLVAPGVSIQSSVPGDAYGDKSGTSMAAPHVTGCFAVFAHKYPSASVTTIETTMESSASVSPSRGGISKPRMDCYAALMALGAATPIAPTGLTTDPTPTYSWNAVATATSYRLWVDRGSRQVRRTWYTAAHAGCAAGTGICRVTPGLVLQNEAHSWRIQARTTEGVGLWSQRIDFSVVGPPGAATLVAPQGATRSATPMYRWNAVAAATSYDLEVRRGSGIVIGTTYTAAHAVCAAGTGTCSVVPNEVLQRGAHSWRIRTGNRYGRGPWSQSVDFTVVGPPGAATLLAPQGTTIATTPTYRWNAVATATSYYLQVEEGFGDAIGTWYTAAQAGCPTGTGTCSVTPSTVLQVGPHGWWIQTRNRYGRGPWSQRAVFTVAGPPGAATLLAPRGTTTDTTPTYSWDPVATATSYHLRVGSGDGDVIGTWYTAAQVGCATGTRTCSVTPSAVLQAGPHGWWIQTRNRRGRGPWSQKQDFVVGTPPAAATLLSPQGPTTDTTPTYSWNAVAAATSYYLRVEDGFRDVIGTWYTAAQVGCAAGTGTCSVTPNTVLQPGFHSWRILTQNPSGDGPWSEELDFAVKVPPGAATLLFPRGPTTGTPPTYSWNAVAAATSYYLRVDRGASSVHGYWYTARQAGCAAGTGTCSITPSTVLQNGFYSWRIQVRNQEGLGAWSARLDFAVGVFGPPGAATPMSPEGTTIGTAPTYSWRAVATATSYKLRVIELGVLYGSGQIMATWYTAEQAGCAAGTGICRITPSTALQGGVHIWWIETRNPYGSGPWSDRMYIAVSAEERP